MLGAAAVAAAVSVMVSFIDQTSTEKKKAKEGDMLKCGALGLGQVPAFSRAVKGGYAPLISNLQSSIFSRVLSFFIQLPFALSKRRRLDGQEEGTVARK